MDKRKEISIDDWADEIYPYCQTISKKYRPESDGKAYQYACEVSELLDDSHYLVRYKDVNGKLLKDYDKHASPITVRDFIGNVDYVSEILKECQGNPDFNCRFGKYVMMTCTSCGRSIIVDGTHRIVKKVFEGRTGEVVNVYELEGSKWPESMPDMEIVCDCYKVRWRAPNYG
jgi:hypothetical protein